MKRSLNRREGAGANTRFPGYALALGAGLLVTVALFQPIETAFTLGTLRNAFPESRLSELAAEASQGVLAALGGGPYEPAPSPVRASGYGLAVRLIAAGRDRGCYSLWTGIADFKSAARAAGAMAARDPRYPPLSHSELPFISLELSVFGAFVPMRSALGFAPGLDSLMLVDAGAPTLIQAGVLTDHGLDKQRFAESVCVKAGLPRDAWQDRSIAWYRAATVRIVRELDLLVALP